MAGGNLLSVSKDSEEELIQGGDDQAPSDLPEPGVDDRPWQSFLIAPKDEKQLPPVVRELFETQFVDGTISITSYACTLANLAMLEIGFVPCFEGHPEITADNLMQENKKERMNWMTRVLVAHATNQFRKLSEVEYKYLKSFVGDNGKIGYMYGDERLMLSFWHNVDTYVSCSFLTPHRETIAFYETRMIYKYISGIDSRQTLTLASMMSLFNGAAFFADIKCNICGVVADRLQSCTFEPIGFSSLPNEMIMHFAEFLDLKSFVNLFVSCRRTYDLLRDDALWEQLCKRIPDDFREYNLAVPSKHQLQIKLRDLGPISYREKYRAIFMECINSPGARHRAFAMRFPLQGYLPFRII